MSTGAFGSGEGHDWHWVFKDKRRIGRVLYIAGTWYADYHPPGLRAHSVGTYPTREAAEQAIFDFIGKDIICPHCGKSFAAEYGKGGKP